MNSKIEVYDDPEYYQEEDIFDNKKITRRAHRLAKKFDQDKQSDLFFCVFCMILQAKRSGMNDAINIREKIFDGINAENENFYEYFDSLFELAYCAIEKYNKHFMIILDYNLKNRTIMTSYKENKKKIKIDYYNNRYKSTHFTFKVSNIDNLKEKIFDNPKYLFNIFKRQYMKGRELTHNLLCRTDSNIDSMKMSDLSSSRAHIKDMNVNCGSNINIDVISYNKIAKKLDKVKSIGINMYQDKNYILAFELSVRIKEIEEPLGHFKFKKDGECHFYFDELFIKNN